MRPNGFASRNPIKGGWYASECIFKIKLSIFEMILNSSVKNWTDWDGHVLDVITHVRNFWLHDNSKITLELSLDTVELSILSDSTKFNNPLLRPSSAKQRRTRPIFEIYSLQYNIVDIISNYMQ